ncbi:MAG: site-specific DNA-methyltransferase [Erythrobacter sp.]|nr:site-specific DNA-methyltransferase [Erythrobacter sp.]
MTKKTKLELTWPGKEERPKLEPRILIEDPDRSYRAEGPGGAQGPGTFDNILIKGDNLLALKALEAEYAGKVKCVFIDPPYNTGSAFEHYDDGLEHSLWLKLLRDRLEIFKKLLSAEGTLWITIDDNEAHYLKIVCDEIFGRKNFVANIVWQKKYSKQNDAKWFSTSHDHILVYAKDKETWRPNEVERTEDQLKGYKNLDNDPRGLWQSVVYTCSKTRAERPNLYYGIEHPKTGKLVFPSETRVWGYDPKRHEQHVRDGLVWWGLNNEKDKPRLKSFLKKVGKGMVPDTLWLRDIAGDNQDAKREAMSFNKKNVFTTPKPEKLLKRIIEIATNPDDLVIDSFAGSGTTGAVAQKMGRRWIMVEIGDHADTHIVPRLKKVIDGEDQIGISKAFDWKGGGGFRYYALAPSLLEKDKWGNWVVAKDYNPDMLAAAMCKHLGFTYAPSEDEGEWWRHGQSSETDFLYVTTQSLSRDALKLLSDEVGEGRSLMICAPAFDGSFDDFENLSCTKIPSAILSRCEWGRDDYSLNVSDPAPAEDDETIEDGENA